MEIPLRVLIVEDSLADAEMLIRELKKGAYQPTFKIVETAETMLQQLNNNIWDIVISDYKMPNFSAPDALKLLQDMNIDLPFIIVSGTIGEEIAVESLKAGAHDFITKYNYSRLVPAIQRELKEATIRQERKKAESEIEKLYKQLRALTAHLQSVREEESTRIAREIHDDLGQTLTAVKMDLALLYDLIGEKDKTLNDKLQSISNLVDSAIQTVRKITTELRPGILDNLGIAPALEWQAEDFEKRTGIKCNFSASLTEMQMDRNISTTLYRITQESLTNIIRHAKATHVSIELNVTDHEIILKIKDNGIGFSLDDLKKPSSFGILGMKERVLSIGGSVSVEGAKGKGTTVIVKAPMERKYGR
jgi:two-component system, NarL family, sensor histidine kinase UhpB